MNDKSITNDLLSILTPVAQGLSSIELAAQEKGLLYGSRRSLQRQLQQLVASGAVHSIGQKKGTRYALAPKEVFAYGAMGTATATGFAAYLPLSPQAQDIQVQISLPLQQRMPVGYRTELLEAYTPNHTHYLSSAQRQQLAYMGQAAMQTSVSAGAPAPAGTFAKDILDRLLIDLSWSSSRLEGNTYSRLDTQKLIEEGLTAPGKDAMQAQMILNHKRAIEYLVHGIGQETSGIGVNRATVIALHALLSDGLLPDSLDSGAVRTQMVGIGGSVYLPLAMPQRIAELFDVVIEMAEEIVDPFEQSFFLMVHLPYLQPFIDVNKRTSRLAANISLIERNLCPLSFIDVPTQAYTEGLLGVYELGRMELLADVYLWAYERSCQQYLAVTQQMVAPDPLRLRYRKELSECIAAIVVKKLDTSLVSVHACLPERVSPPDRDALAGIIVKELRALHAGNAVRFGISGLQFQAWRDTVPSA